MTRPPDDIRRWQLTDLDANHNKYWQVEVWYVAGGDPLVRVTFGRVGAAAPANATAKPMTRQALAAKIAEKTGKGYVEVAVTRSGDLDVAQIGRGRTLLDQAEQAWRRGDMTGLVSAVESYCNVIPTQLPARIDPQAVSRTLMGNLTAQRARLDALARGLAPATPAPPAAPAQRQARTSAPVRVVSLPEPAARQARASDVDWSAVWIVTETEQRQARAAGVVGWDGGDTVPQRAARA